MHSSSYFNKKENVNFTASINFNLILLIENLLDYIVLF